jgi:hypothetical protein
LIKAPRHHAQPAAAMVFSMVCQPSLNSFEPLLKSGLGRENGLWGSGIYQNN